MVGSSEHFIAFTGAGISTSAGIPDYRSGMDTVLPTGPGCWEKAANKGKKGSKATMRTSIAKAIPTKSHMGFVGLMEAGFLKFIISQNVDGLHWKSGIPAHKIAELHGNTNLENCKDCGRQYMRDFRVRTAQTVKAHETGRFCDDEECKGELFDSIINFGENLPQDELEQGFTNGESADLCVVMGTSCWVSPACDMPRSTAENGGKLVICNL